MLSFRRQAFDGAFGQFLDGDHAGGTATLLKIVGKIRRMPILRRCEELNEMCFLGEIELTLGDPIIGTAILEAVTTVPDNHDLLHHAIDRAHKLLAGETGGPSVGDGGGSQLP